jgi:hypothetical protein
MTSVTVVACDRLPLVPVIVSGNVPVGNSFAGFDRCALIVSVDVPFPVMDDGLKLDRVPAGNPVTEKFTFPLKPFVPEIVMVYVVEFPRTTVWLDGVAAIVKSVGPAEFTTSVTVVE